MCACDSAAAGVGATRRRECDGGGTRAAALRRRRDVAAGESRRRAQGGAMATAVRACGRAGVRARHVDKEEGARLVANVAHACVVPIARVGGGARDDHLGPEDHRRLLELSRGRRVLASGARRTSGGQAAAGRRRRAGGGGCRRRAAHVVVIDEAGLAVDVVGEGLEVDGRGRDLLLGGVVAVREMAARRQVEPHDAVVRREQRSVDGEVGGRAGVGLHVDAPLGRIAVERGERARAAQVLHLVNDLVAAIVARARHALRVLVGHARAEALHHRLGGEVLGRDELDAMDLPLLLLEQEAVDLRVPVLQVGVSARGHGVCGRGARRVSGVGRLWCVSERFCGRGSRLRV